MGTEVRAVCKTWMGNCLTLVLRTDQWFSIFTMLQKLLICCFISSYLAKYIEMVWILYSPLFLVENNGDEEKKLGFQSLERRLIFIWVGVRCPEFDCVFVECPRISFPVDQIPKLAQCLWPVGRLDNRQIMDSGEIIWNMRRDWRRSQKSRINPNGERLLIKPWSLEFKKVDKVDLWWKVSFPRVPSLSGWMWMNSCWWPSLWFGPFYLPAKVAIACSYFHRYWQRFFYTTASTKTRKYSKM